MPVLLRPLVTTPNRSAMIEPEYSAFVINLDSRPDRLAEFRRRTRRYSIPIERLPALTPQEVVDLGLVAECTLWQACNASHTAICRLMIERDLQWALVLEDDVLPILGFERRVRWALEAAPPEAWIIQLGHLGTAGSRVRRTLRSLGGHFLRRMNTQRREQYWWGSQAYLISRRFAEFILEQPFPPTGHDRFLRRLSVETELRYHCVTHHPNLAGQSPSRSDIGAETDAIPGKAHASREWRRLLP